MSKTKVEKMNEFIKERVNALVNEVDYKYGLDDDLMPRDVATLIENVFLNNLTDCINDLSQITYNVYDLEDGRQLAYENVRESTLIKLFNSLSNADELPNAEDVSIDEIIRCIEINEWEVEILK